MKLLKRYQMFVVAMIGLLALAAYSPEMGKDAVDTVGYSMKEMVTIIPPIFVLLGLLDVWVPREVLIKFMGKDSRLTGALLGLFLGSAAAGPLYGAFPVAGVLMKKGACLRNVFIFIGAWSTTKIPLLLFEMSALGAQFMLTRLAVSLVGIFFIAMMLQYLLGDKERQSILQNAAEMSE
ncbi:MAG TPA: permease [Eubacteriaceae bacterium]|nr:permease [Eubacteriaceae bacterium]